jgi:RimJ/RimL family protein N-acetyltransferase
VFRRAGADEFVALYELEKAASLTGLSHIFPAETSPFPDDEVQARYRLWFEDPAFRVLVADQGGRLSALVAYDPDHVRQLSVHPDFWGTGLATRIVDACLDDLAALGRQEVSLWVLADNHRARRFYERTGWQQTAETSTSQFAPYPTTVGYRRSLRRRGHGGD